MSAFEYFLKGLHDTILVASNVNRLTANVERLNDESHDHDKRLIRLETLVEVAARTPSRSSGPKRLKDE